MKTIRISLFAILVAFVLNLPVHAQEEKHDGVRIVRFNVTKISETSRNTYEIFYTFSDKPDKPVEGRRMFMDLLNENNVSFVQDLKPDAPMWVEYWCYTQSDGNTVYSFIKFHLNNMAQQVETK